MIALAEMLVEPAKKAGMRVPRDIHKCDKRKYPHWHVFCVVQLGRFMPSPTSHWQNAEVIAKIPDARIRRMSLAELVAAGVQ